MEGSMMRPAVLMLALGMGFVAIGTERARAAAEIKCVAASELFKFDKERASAKRQVLLEGAKLGPGADVACGKTRIQGEELCELAGRELAVEEQGDTAVIKGWCKK
jgi:hypothetical protein